MLRTRNFIAIYCLIFMNIIWILDNVHGLSYMFDYTSDELQNTFGVGDRSNVPDHELVWPSVDFLNDTDGNYILNRLFIRVDDQSLSIPLSLVDDPMRVSTGGRNCHYRSAENDSDDFVHAAVSNCDGELRGTIITDKQLFTLHPLPKPKQKYGPVSISNDTVTRQYKTHVLIKRQSLTSTNRANVNEFCGIQSSRPISNVARDEPILDIGSTARRVSLESAMTVEIAVFADYEMWKKYWAEFGTEADNKLQDFISTVFNNIQILYQHPTMSYRMNFQIVHYDVLKSQPDAISGYRHRNGDAQMYLDSFCLYQYGFTGRTWDQAIVFTGYDLHRNYGQDKSISGIARLYGACDPFNSCVLVEAHDFTSVYIATHEIGHGFGMRHDEPYCSSTFIMSGSLGPGKVTWSSCSMNDMGKFLEKLDYNGKNCLRQTNGYSALSIDMSQLPGQKYDADAQCSKMHGASYHHVIPRNQYSEGACSMMWCGMNGYGRIITAHPALEGSYCGDRRYCIRGQCQVWVSDAPLIPRVSNTPQVSNTPRVSNTPQDPAWTDWTKPNCALCVCAPFEGGLGILQSTRSCPGRVNGGRDCTGEYVRGIVCNTNCPATADTVDAYVARQCEWRRSQGNDAQMTGKGAQLLRSDSRACRVFCDIRPTTYGAKNYRYYGDQLPDGTPCSHGKYCVAGRCLPLTCDNTALVNDQTSCPNNFDRCSITGPTFPQVLPTQAVISTSSVANPSQWSVWSQWTQCSVSCENGIQTRRRHCNATSCTGSFEEHRQCNKGPCENNLQYEDSWSQWSAWSTCSSSCGEGKQTRTRTCSGRCGSYSTDAYTETRPCFGEACGAHWSSWGMWSECYYGAVAQIRIRTCQGQARCPGQKDNSAMDRQQRPCPDADVGRWLPWTSWTSCTRSCGGGMRTRVRTCSNNEKGACEQAESTQQESCAGQDCPYGARVNRGAVLKRFVAKLTRKSSRSVKGQ